jgi:hypothetical protein
MKAKKFDRKFDKGEDVTQFPDMSKAQRAAQEQRRVNVDLPTWMMDSLDREAKRLRVTRQLLIRVAIANRLEKDKTPKSLDENETIPVKSHPLSIPFFTFHLTP